MRSGRPSASGPTGSWTRSCPELAHVSDGLLGARAGGEARLRRAQSPPVRRVRVLHFGTYERAYPRNAQVASALRRAGVEVVERHVPGWDGARDWTAGPGTAARIGLAELRLARRVPPAVDRRLRGHPVHPRVP